MSIAKKQTFSITIALCLMVSMTGYTQSFELSESNEIPSQRFAETLAVENQAYQNNSWWTPSYLIDYAIVVGGIAGYAIGKDLVSRDESMIGPSYDPDNLLDLFASDDLNRTYLEQDVEESVPEYWIHRAIALSGGFLLGMEWREHRSGRGSPQQMHQTFVGYAEAVAVNAAFTELLKPVFSRLRPDFRERALRFHCGDLDSPEFDSFCDGYRDLPLADDPDEARDLLEDGRKSFYSGHSSNSFSLFGYASLAIGGRYVWGEDASRRSRIVGITLQTGSMAFATYISASRVSDGRHFVSDTVVGAAAGLAIANLSYWRRFDRGGNVRSRGGSATQSEFTESRRQTSVSINPWVWGGQGGLQMNVSF